MLAWASRVQKRIFKRPIHATTIFHTENCQTKNLCVKIPKSLR